MDFYLNQALYIPEDLIIEQVISHPKTSTIHSNDDKVSYFSTSTLESLKQCEISLKQNSGKYKLFSLKTSAIGGTFDYLHCGHKVISINCFLYRFLIFFLYISLY